MRILYIDIDSLRPDHLGCYGYHRATSPNIDRIAAEGLLFHNAYVSDAPCLPSRSAFYSGRFGIHTGVVNHGGVAAQPKIEGPARGFQDHFATRGLASRLQGLGYHTAMISPFGQRHAAWHFYAGFHEIHNTGKEGMESAEMVQPVVETWLDANVSRDQWFLHVNFWDPHTPYRVPGNAPNPFSNDPLPAWLDDEKLIARHNRVPGPHTSLEVSMYSDATRPEYPNHPGKVTDKASMRKMIDGYDHGVHYVDQQIGKIVEKLKAAGVYDETMIIISADHGENLGELGIYAEHGTADQITCRIPLIIKYPGGVAGAANTRLHYQVDLAPTLMELLGGEPDELWDGASYAAAILSGADVGRDEVVFGQCSHVCQRSVRWGNWLYLRTYHDGFHLFPQEMLFNVEADPHEQHDLAPARPDLCREGAWRLARWHDAQMQKMARFGHDVVDPLWTVIREGGPFHARLALGDGTASAVGGLHGFKRYLQRLETTGRADGAEALRQKYAARLSDLEALTE
ncbi:MAG TPA: sulfatase [Chthoniobacteraceae bacterium]|nr:sulfatase [Chthoniobacteraceae bacterium]